jgi:heme-degrading monooxygenase HmoA
MFIRFGSFAVKPGQASQLRSKYNGVAVPRVRACAGNIGCMLLEPADGNESFGVITIWATRADAEAYEASGAATEVMALVKEFFAGPPTLRSYESSSSTAFSR